MMPNMRAFYRAGKIGVLSVVAMCCSGCMHKVTGLSSSPLPTAGATLKVEFLWAVSTEDELGTTRTVGLSGKQVSSSPDTRFVSCFGADRRNAKCQFVERLNTTASTTVVPEYDGTESITNAQLGLWVVTAEGESSEGVTASQACAVDVNASRIITVKITFGVGPSCLVQ